MLSYSETLLVELKMEAFHAKQVRILIQREDLNHPFISGNKWWKLKYNIEEALKQGKKTLLTFGGAYSNHIYATAAAAHDVGLKSIGVIRGEATLPLNPTLTFAHTQGMHLYYVSREVYRKKTAPEFIAQLHDQFGDFYLIPEGGTNELALKGTQELGEKLLTEIEFDYLCLPVGTGGTMAGIINGFKGEKEILGVSSLKRGSFLEEEIKKWIKNKSSEAYGNWHVLTSYDHGGYAKVTEELLEFIKKVNHEYGLPLDHVYTGKLLWGVLEEMKKNTFRKGSTVLVLHTGGLQGSHTKLK